MEKLQAALQNARVKRSAEGTAPVNQREVTKTPRLQTCDPQEDTWAALASFDPDQAALLQSRIVTQEASEEATPFDILRTKILLQMRQNNWTRLAVTSPMPQSGKTTVSCNLALGLGRQHGLRSMLLDLDLRDPSVGNFFQHRPARSIGEVLTQDVSFAEQAVRIGDNLAVSMSNRMEQDPTRILLSERAEEALDQIQEDYKPDVMIFDMPSVLVNDDTRAFLKNVDCALIISRANATRYQQLDKSEREVAEHTNVLGVVLNACRSPGTSFDSE